MRKVSQWANVSACLAFVVALWFLFQSDVLISTVLSNPLTASVRPRKTIVFLKSCFCSKLITLERTAADQSELSSE